VGADGVLVDMAHLKMADALAQRQALIEAATHNPKAKRP
jgi:hypothetical protein